MRRRDFISLVCGGRLRYWRRSHSECGVSVFLFAALSLIVHLGSSLDFKDRAVWMIRNTLGMYSRQERLDGKFAFAVAIGGKADMG
jgi:hypothetical protein